MAAGRARRLIGDALRRDPDDRWAAVFGGIAGYSFAVAAVTGILLPSSARRWTPSGITVPTANWTAFR